jgi:deoxyribonuclease-4
MGAFDAALGIGQIEAIHFNDALKELGSKRDRHAHIGKGCIGPGGFWSFMNDARLDGKAGLLETDKGEDLAEDREAITLLRSLVGAPFPPAAVHDEVATTAD